MKLKDSRKNKKEHTGLTASSIQFSWEAGISFYKIRCKFSLTTTGLVLQGQILCCATAAKHAVRLMQRGGKSGIIFPIEYPHNRKTLCFFCSSPKCKNMHRLE